MNHHPGIVIRQEPNQGGEAVVARLSGWPSSAYWFLVVTNDVLQWRRGSNRWLTFRHAGVHDLPLAVLPGGFAAV